MGTSDVLWAEVDGEGRLVVPAEVVEAYGLTPGARARLELEKDNLRLHRPVTHLAKLYAEPTNRCNIECRTCMRQGWDTELGKMSDETFERILGSVAKISPRPTVFFGGIGEPLFHPGTIDMVGRAKATGATVELITNGILLNEERARGLIAAGLDTLWVSIDGASPESYADVRLGAELPTVLENMKRFRKLRPPAHRPKPVIGIAFVAMKRNLDDLPKVLALGRSLGAKLFMVSNVLPHTEEMAQETLYNRVLSDIAYLPSAWLPEVNLPKMEMNETTRTPFFEALNRKLNVTYAGNNFGGANDVCVFIESGSLAIGWDGSVSPCPPLLYNHVQYLNGWRRLSKRHIVGDVGQVDLLSIWRDPEYVAYRERVQSFAFPPCTFCGGCDLLDSNEEDCLGNEFPVCGGCLWAQAVIRCP
jgi:MoaA/NifB/PqqE/SkfB family radical SAM enzyme